MVDLSYLPEPLRNPNNCHKDLISGWPYSYGYRPSLAAGIVFCLLFGIALFGHCIQAIRLRRWTSILLAIGVLTKSKLAAELIGWIGRTWSAECPYNQNAYLMQITTLIIAPVFVTAAIYVLLGLLIMLLGREASILSPRMYNIVFVTCDVISLVLQAIGGAMASQASGQRKDPTPGTNVMLGGVVFQLISMTLFAGLAIDFTRRLTRMSVPSGHFMVIGAMFVSLTAVYIRSIFRTIELAEGWTGYLMTHEKYFVGLDGCLMVLAVGVLLLFDPAWIIPRYSTSFRRSSTGPKSSDAGSSIEM
ncbi:Uncharacterized protein LSUE1_G002740 [Lachnellula suecica]|uniref:Sphingoid long-chain base transporter RSB1 n=1 Tax=Lachnellula suecica TaxID=602035 RepID=A0A8T9CKB1_9HELO|nr:Uncharacterized protein LSUE1_G002740 [Lachnellula suecica]